MKLLHAAAAGTLESSDALITVEPAGQLEIHIQSPVQAQFGPQIEAAVRAVLADFAVAAARVAVQDRGALDCVLRARCEAALLRAAKEE